MRNKIDNLILINLCLLIPISIRPWLSNSNVFLGCFVFAVCIMAIELWTIKGIPEHVEKSARARLIKRTSFNALTTLTLALIYLSYMIQLD